jgi:hypothetical protein
LKKSRRNLKKTKSLEKKEKPMESLIISAVEEKKPDSVEQLVNLIKEEGFSEESITKEITRLEELGRLRLEPSAQDAQKLRPPIFSLPMLWYWLVTFFSALAIVSVLAISASSFPLVIVRWISGLAVVLYIPGFCFVKALFRNRIDWLENVIWSVSLSLILVILTALFWNFTPLGLSTVPIVVTLALFSFVSATAAVLYRNSQP